MRLARLLGPAILVAGLIALALAVMRGEANVYLILVIPAVVGTGPLAVLGILLVFLGFFLTVFLGLAGAAPPMPGPPQVSEAGPRDAKPPSRWGGVVFLGPIPLVFGSDPQMTRTMLILGVILFLALLAVTLVVLLA